MESLHPPAPTPAATSRHLEGGPGQVYFRDGVSPWIGFCIVQVSSLHCTMSLMLQRSQLQPDKTVPPFRGDLPEWRTRSVRGQSAAVPEHTVRAQTECLGYSLLQLPRLVRSQKEILWCGNWIQFPWSHGHLLLRETHRAPWLPGDRGVLVWADLEPASLIVEVVCSQELNKCASCHKDTLSHSHTHTFPPPQNPLL